MQDYTSYKFSFCIILVLIAYTIIRTLCYKIYNIHISGLINKYIKTKNQEYGRKALFLITKQGSSANNINKIRELIKQGLNINLPDRKGNTALIIASKNKRENFYEMTNKTITATEIINGEELPVKHISTIIQLLIENGADINLRNNKGNTALVEAALNNNYYTVKSLIKNGADTNTLPNDMDLIIACENGDVNKVKSLIEKGANVNFSCKIPDFFANNPISYRNDVEQYGNDFYNTPMGKDPHKTYTITPLLKVCDSKRTKENIEIAKILLENGARINKKDSKRRTALSIATKNNNTEMVELLKSYGAKE